MAELISERSLHSSTSRVHRSSAHLRVFLTSWFATKDTQFHVPYFANFLGKHSLSLIVLFQTMLQRGSDLFQALLGLSKRSFESLFWLRRVPGNVNRHFSFDRFTCLLFSIYILILLITGLFSHSINHFSQP